MTEQEWMNTTTRLVADYVWCAVEHTKALNSPRLAGRETLREKRVAAHAALMAHVRTKLPLEPGDLTLAYMAGAGRKATRDEAWVAQAMLLAHTYRHAGTAPGPVGEAERKLKAFLTNQGE